MKTFISALALLSASSVMAADSLTLTAIIPYAAGGPTDTEMRVIAESANKVGLKIIIENKPGLEGLIGANYVAEKKGELILLVGSHSINVLAPKQKLEGVSFDPLKSFIPVIATVDLYQLLVVSPKQKDITLRQLVKEHSEDPNKFNFGVVNSTGLVVYDKIFKETRSKGTTVPYKSGPALALDLVASRIDIGVAPISNFDAMIKAGKLSPIAVTAKKRLEEYPDVPVIGEVFPGFSISSWHGLFFPVGVSKDVVSHVNAIVDKILHSPEVKERLLAQHNYVKGGSPQALNQLVQEGLSE